MMGRINKKKSVVRYKNILLKSLTSQTYTNHFIRAITNAVKFML